MEFQIKDMISYDQDKLINSDHKLIEITFHNTWEVEIDTLSSEGNIKDNGVMIIDKKKLSKEIMDKYEAKITDILSQEKELEFSNYEMIWSHILRICLRRQRKSYLKRKLRKITKMEIRIIIF